MIFLAGVGAEDENGKPGEILHKGDFVAQCKYAYDKIKRLLEKHGAGFGDVVKIVSYVTDMRYQTDFASGRGCATHFPPSIQRVAIGRRDPYDCPNSRRSAGRGARHTSAQHKKTHMF